PLERKARVSHAVWYTPPCSRTARCTKQHGSHGEAQGDTSVGGHETDRLVESRRARERLGVDVEHDLVEACIPRGLESAREEGRRDLAASVRAAHTDEVDVGAREPLGFEVLLVDFRDRETGDLTVGCD